MDALKASLSESQTLKKAVHVQYSESALSYSLMHLKKETPDKSAGTMKQIIVEHLAKLNKNFPERSLEGNASCVGESLVHPALLAAAKQHI